MTVSLGWQVLAVVALSAVLAILAVLLTRAFDFAESSLIAMPGYFVVPMMIVIIRPKSAKQLALTMVAVAVGGTLAILTALAIKFLAWGTWADVVGAGLATVLGIGAATLFCRYLGVEMRPSPPEDRT